AMTVSGGIEFHRDLLAVLHIVHRQLPGDAALGQRGYATRPDSLAIDDDGQSTPRSAYDPRLEKQWMIRWRIAMDALRIDVCQWTAQRHLRIRSARRQPVFQLGEHYCSDRSPLAPALPSSLDPPQHVAGHKILRVGTAEPGIDRRAFGPRVDLDM